MPTNERPRLSQIVAVAKSSKSNADSSLARAHHTLQKADTRENSPLAGIARTFRALDDNEAERRPDESTLVQIKVEDIITATCTDLTRMFDVIATQEWGNAHATADLVVDGTVLLSNIPVTYFMFLEKQLVRIHTFFTELPTLSPNEIWSRDADTGWMVTAPTESRTTKKIPKNHELSPAIPPSGGNPGLAAQVTTYNEDVTVGFWTTRRFSGAISPRVKAQLTDRVEILLRAVKEAREEANATRIDQIKVGHVLFGYLLDPIE